MYISIEPLSTYGGHQTQEEVEDVKVEAGASWLWIEFSKHSEVGRHGSMSGPCRLVDWLCQPGIAADERAAETE